jgi:hypothetical protein
LFGFAYFFKRYALCCAGLFYCIGRFCGTNGGVGNLTISLALVLLRFESAWGCLAIGKWVNGYFRDCLAGNRGIAGQFIFIWRCGALADKQDMVKLIDSRVKSWFWLYNSVIDRQGWDMYKKMVYAVLACHSDGGSRWVEISSATIAEHAGCSVRKVRSVIDDLAAEGVLEIKSGMTAKAYRVVQNEASDMSKGRWFWCDKFLFERKDLDIYEKLVYLVLVRHADGKNRRAMVSYANIAMGAGCSRRKAIDVVGSLVEKGLLLEPVVTEKGNIYFINNVLAETFSGAVCEDVEQQEEAEVVHGVQGAAPGALVHAVQGAAPGALVHGVQGGAAPCAPVRGQVVHGVHGDRDRAIELIEGELSVAGLSGEPVILIEDQDDAVRVVIHYVRHVPAPAMLNTAGNFDVTGHAVYRRDKQ